MANLKDAIADALGSGVACNVLFRVGAGWTHEPVSSGRSLCYSIGRDNNSNGPIVSVSSDDETVLADLFYEALGYSDTDDAPPIPKFLLPEEYGKPKKKKRNTAPDEPDPRSSWGKPKKPEPPKPAPAPKPKKRLKIKKS